jgi:hypothetical protein
MANYIQGMLTSLGQKFLLKSVIGLCLKMGLTSNYIIILHVVLMGVSLFQCCSNIAKIPNMNPK